MDNLKQKKVVELLSENVGKPLGEAMVEAGYSKSYSESPGRLKRTKSWERLLNKYFPDELLVKVTRKGLNAKRTIAAQVIVKTDDPRVRQKQATARDVDFIDVPDWVARHQFLTTALKLKDKFPKDKGGFDLTSGGFTIKIEKINENNNLAADSEAE